MNVRKKYFIGRDFTEITFDLKMMCFTGGKLEPWMSHTMMEDPDPLDWSQMEVLTSFSWLK